MSGPAAGSGVEDRRLDEHRRHAPVAECGGYCVDVVERNDASVSAGVLSEAEVFRLRPAVLGEDLERRIERPVELAVEEDEALATRRRSGHPDDLEVCEVALSVNCQAGRPQRSASASARRASSGPGNANCAPAAACRTTASTTGAGA